MILEYSHVIDNTNMRRFLFVICTLLMAVSCVKGPTFINLSTERLQIPIEGGVRMISVKTDGEWTLDMADDVSWCVPSESSGSGNANIRLTISSNEGGKTRKTTLTFVVSGVDSKTVIVEQLGVGGQTGGDNAYPAKESGITVSPEKPNADQPCTIKFNPVSGNPLYNHEGELYGHLGVIVEDEWNFVPCEWAINDEKVHFKKVGDNSWELELSPSIREYFGSGDTPVNKIGVIVRSEDGEIKSHEADQFCSVTDDQYQVEEFVPDPVVNEPVPAGVEYGINCKSNGSVTFVLYDKNLDGGHSEYCYIVGDWNQWQRVPEGAMKRDDAAGCWWITLDGFDPSVEYRFQYRLGTKTGTDIRIGDP